MIQRKILFLFFFLPFPLTSCTFNKLDDKPNEVQKQKIPVENKIPKVLDKKELNALEEELIIPVKNFSENRPKEMKTSNDKEVTITENLRNKLYVKFAFGYSDLKNYDVYNTSTNEATWDDRYTKLGNIFEIGLGYDFGRIRTEISYSQENGRFDEYLTYFDNSVTKIEKDRGKLQKDFYMINSYYDFREGRKISPFIGLGFGLVNSSQDSAPFIPEYVSQVFVLELKGGFSYKISEKNYIYLEGFKRDANSHITSDGLGTADTYKAKDGFDSSGLLIGLRKIL